MAHFAISCPPLPGHINPMAALARELQTRGHRVTFIGFPDMRKRLPADVAFRTFAEEEWPEGSLDPFLRSLAKLGGPLSLRRLILDLAAFLDSSCRHLPTFIEKLSPDFLIVDQADTAASLVASSLGVPFVNIANALPLNAEPGVPPPVLPWAYDPSPSGVRRNLGGYRIARLVERPITKVVRRHAERLGRKDVRFADECWSSLGQITQCVRALDFPRACLPRNFHYVGPIRDADQPLHFELPDDGRPLIFCSLGTLQGSRLSIFATVAKAVAKLDAQLLIAHGGLLDERKLKTLPGGPLVHSFVPQRAVLARSAMAVTHCGFNTVLDALSFGVPLLAMPIAFEQPATGARLKRAGVAEVINRWRTPSRIRSRINKLLCDSSYRRAAAGLQAEIAAAGGVQRAADIIETARAGVPGEVATTGRAVTDDVRGDNRNGNS